MLCFTKVHFSGRVRIFKHNFLSKRVLTLGKDEVEDSKSKNNFLKSINKFLIPPLTVNRLKEMNEITGIMRKMGYVSWAKVSTQTLAVTEWNFQSYPDDFRNLDEVSLLKFACSLKEIIPSSDLYVMEKIQPREESKLLNDLRLSSMLMVLLNNCNNGARERDKLVFQSEYVMNKLYDILIGRERVSPRKVLEKILGDFNREGATSKNHDFVRFSFCKINLEFLKFYDKALLEQQESLSYVLLLILSFIDVFIHQNAESLSKIQMQSRLRTFQSEFS